MLKLIIFLFNIRKYFFDRQSIFPELISMVVLRQPLRAMLFFLGQLEPEVVKRGIKPAISWLNAALVRQVLLRITV